MDQRRDPCSYSKDEFLAKLYAFSTLDKTTATGLLFTREQQLNKIMQKNQAKLADLSVNKKRNLDVMSLFNEEFYFASKNYNGVHRFVK